MNFFLITLFVAHSALATQRFASVPNSPNTHSGHLVPQNTPHGLTPQVLGHQAGNVRRGRWLADSIAVDPVYKTIWSPSWTSSGWSVADSGLYYSAPVSGHKVVAYAPESVPTWKVAGEPVSSWKMAGEPVPSWNMAAEPTPSWKVGGEPVPSWKVAAEPTPSWKVGGEPVPSWKVAAYEPSWKVPVSSWKVAPKEESWKWVSDKWDGSNKWVADDKTWSSVWSAPGSVVSSGPSFYGAPSGVWSSPVVKKQQSWAYVDSVPKSVSYYGPQPVESVGAYSAKYKSVYDDSYAKPFHYSSTIVHEKPASVYQ